MWIISKHRHIKPETISEYLDGRLSTREQDRVGKAVAECAECQGELESLQATVSLLYTLPAFAPSRSFVLTAAPAAGPAITAEPPRFSPRRVPGWAYAGAASLAGLAVILLVLADGGLPSLQWPSGSDEPAALAMAESAPVPVREMLEEQTASAPAPAAMSESMPVPDAMAEPTAAPQAMSGAAPSADSEMMAVTESAQTMEQAAAPAATPQAMAAKPASIAQPAAAPAPRKATPASIIEQEFLVEKEVVKEVPVEREVVIAAVPAPVTTEPALLAGPDQSAPQEEPAQEVPAATATATAMAAPTPSPTSSPTPVPAMAAETEMAGQSEPELSPTPTAAPEVEHQVTSEASLTAAEQKAGLKETAAAGGGAGAQGMGSVTPLPPATPEVSREAVTSRQQTDGSAASMPGGPAGPVGPAGDTGPIGPQGAMGATGLPEVSGTQEESSVKLTGSIIGWASVGLAAALVVTLLVLILRRRRQRQVEGSQPQSEGGLKGTFRQPDTS